MKYFRVYGQFAASAVVGLVLAAGVASCGGGTTGLAGIGGTGITANGRITGFGSIFVNGIEFDTNAAKILVSGSELDQSALKLGMVVTITGTVDANGLKGVADSVSFRAELKGPVVNPLVDTAGQTLSFSVLGIPVIADKATTVFSADGYAGFGFATVAANDIVEISGFYDAAGKLNATHIEKSGVHGADPTKVTEVEIRGVISGFVANQSKFTLASGVEVDYSGNVILRNMPADWTNLAVEVEGYLQGPMAIKAFRIEAADRGLPHDADHVEVEGIVSGYQGLGNFKVAGQPVNASGAGVRFEPASLALSDGAQVEVEGSMVGGVLIAREVKGRGGNIEIEAFVTAVDTATKIVTLAITSATTAKVAVDYQTLMKDETGAVANLTFADIHSGDFLEIEAFGDPATLCAPDCTVRATHVKRTSAGNAVKLQGPVATFDGTERTITILNIRFKTNGATVYEGDGITSATAFFSALAPGVIVTAKDTRDKGLYSTGDGIAEKLEIDD